MGVTSTGTMKNAQEGRAQSLCSGTGTRLPHRQKFPVTCFLFPGHTVPRLASRWNNCHSPPRGSGHKCRKSWKLGACSLQCLGTENSTAITASGWQPSSTYTRQVTQKYKLLTHP